MGKQIDHDTLTYLLRGGHINMPDRIDRGLWPHPPIKYSDIVRHLVRIIESEKWFPREWTPAVPGETVWEGGVIERKSRWQYIYRTQRHHPLNPRLLAEEYRKIFFTAKGVAKHYLKWDLHLPGKLDGWLIVE